MKKECALLLDLSKLKKKKNYLEIERKAHPFSRTINNLEGERKKKPVKFTMLAEMILG